MASKADFSEAEWKAMEQGVTGAGMLVSISDTDFTDTIPEVGALASYLAQQRQTSASELVRDLAGARIGSSATRAPWQVESDTLSALRTSTAMLATKAPDEVSAYRELVLGAATAVAATYGGVTRVETDVIAKLEAVLGPE